MPRYVGWFLVLGMTVALASPAEAQRPGRGQRGGPAGPGGFGARGMGMTDSSGLMLLSIPAVQNELNLESTQIQQVREVTSQVQEKRRGLFQELQDLPMDQRREKAQEMMETLAAESRQAVDEILDAEQKTRFEQIRLQQQGIAALMEPEVQQKLELTDEQQQKIEELQREQLAQMSQLRQGAQGNFQAIAQRMQSLRQQTLDKATAELTDEQKATWSELLGAPFELSFEGGPRRRGVQ